MERLQLAKGLVNIIFLTCLATSIFAAFYWIDTETAFILIIFDLLLGLIIFMLRGSVTKKLGVLTFGNLVGLFWNMIFFYFSIEGFIFFGESFSVYYTLIYPMLNLMWVIPFWSLSLSALPCQGNIQLQE